MYVIVYRNTKTDEMRTAIVDNGVQFAEVKWELQLEIIASMYTSCNVAVQRGIEEHIISAGTFEAFDQSLQFEGEIDRWLQRDAQNRVILHWTDIGVVIWDNFITKLHPEWVMSYNHPTVYASYRHSHDGQASRFSHIDHSQTPTVIDLLVRGATVLLDGYWFKTEPYTAGEKGEPDYYESEDKHHHIEYGIVVEEPVLAQFTTNPMQWHDRDTTHEGVLELYETIEGLKERKEKKNDR